MRGGCADGTRASRSSLAQRSRRRWRSQPGMGTSPSTRSRQATGSRLRRGRGSPPPTPTPGGATPTSLGWNRLGRGSRSTPLSPPSGSRQCSGKHSLPRADPGESRRHDGHQSQEYRHHLRHQNQDDPAMWTGVGLPQSSSSTLSTIPGSQKTTPK